MRDVYLIGIGQTAVSKNGGVRGRYLAADAIAQAIRHAGIDPADIGMLVVGNMMSGILAQQQLRLSRFMVCCASHNKEAPPMAHLQCTDMQDRPTEFLDLTSLTLDEFQQLVPPFETAFQAH